MIVTALKLTNVRAIETAEFTFRPGFNLIVGVNGVGKTTVLQALSVVLAAVVKQVNGLKASAEAMAPEDIRSGAEALTIECSMRIGAGDYRYLIHQPRETSVPQTGGEGLPRSQVHETPARFGFFGTTPASATGDEAGGRPFAMLFSTNRAVPSERAPSKRAATGGVAAAFAEAFAPRELRLGDLAAWIRTRAALASEDGDAERLLPALQAAVERFLPGYANLAALTEERSRLTIDRKGATIAVRQLSDGERGILALVLELTKRLAQANPGMRDPAAEAEAVVLIDEIDLHLHPKWQRRIVRNLTAAFPKCQFIATTHSPQVIGEVTQDRIQIMVDGLVYSPSHSYGVDSSRVLEETMDTERRTHEVQEILTSISHHISKSRFTEARATLQTLIAVLGEDDPEVTRITTLLEFMEDEEE